MRTTQSAAEIPTPDHTHEPTQLVRPARASKQCSRTTAHAADDGMMDAPALRLLTMTTISAFDGTLLALIAAGGLTTWTSTIIVGLTVIAGAGAWIAARDAYGGRLLTKRDGAELGAIFAATAIATLAATLLAVHLGEREWLYLPYVGGVVLLVLGIEMGGVRLPKVPLTSSKAAPLPIVLATAGIVLEVLGTWIP